HYLFFFFSSRRRHTRSKRDWSSDVCSSDLSCGRRTRGWSRRRKNSGSVAKCGWISRSYTTSFRPIFSRLWRRSAMLDKIREWYSAPKVEEARKRESELLERIEDAKIRLAELDLAILSMKRALEDRP